jgi:hypothetical protein
MKPEEQIIAIAEARGWTFEKKPRCNMLSKRPAWHIISPEGKINCGIEIWHETRYGKESNYAPFEGELVNYLNESGVPDYLNDLNAMHEAVKTLPQNIKPRYFACLCFVVRGAISLNGYSAATEATAAQRAEAFLRTIDKWTTNQNEL